MALGIVRGVQPIFVSHMEISILIFARGKDAKDDGGAGLKKPKAADGSDTDSSAN